MTTRIEAEKGVIRDGHNQRSCRPNELADLANLFEVVIPTGGGVILEMSDPIIRTMVQDVRPRGDTGAAVFECDHPGVMGCDQVIVMGSGVVTLPGGEQIRITHVCDADWLVRGGL